MRHEQIPVPAELAAWFSRAALTTVDPGPSTALDEPDHGTVLSWRPGSADVVVAGPQARARYHASQGGTSCVRLRFRTGRAAEFLGLPLRDLLDRTAPVPRDIAGVVIGALRPGRVTGPVRRSGTAPHERLLHEAAALLTAGRSLAETARGLHISERHLRTLFVTATGLTPSRYVGIGRVRSVLRHLDEDLPEVARRAGYYDQSHMTAEFRRVMGVPPHAFRTRRWPAARPCGPYRIS